MKRRATSLLTKVTLTGDRTLKATGSYLLFGVIFGSAGLGAIALGIYLDVFENEENAWFLYLFGLFFVVAGAQVGGMRDRLDINDRGLRYEQLLWFRSHLQSLDRSNIKSVALSAVVEGDSSKPDYQVNLELTDTTLQEGMLRLSQKSKEFEARNLAELIAQHLDLPLRDMIGGDSQSWKPTSSGRSLGQPKERGNSSQKTEQH